MNQPMPGGPSCHTAPLGEATFRAAAVVFGLVGIALLPFVWIWCARALLISVLLALGWLLLVVLLRYTWREAWLEQRRRAVGDTILGARALLDLAWMQRPPSRATPEQDRATYSAEVDRTSVEILEQVGRVLDPHWKGLLTDPDAASAKPGPEREAAMNQLRQSARNASNEGERAKVLGDANRSRALETLEELRQALDMARAALSSSTMPSEGRRILGGQYARLGRLEERIALGERVGFYLELIKMLDRLQKRACAAHDRTQLDSVEEMAHAIGWKRAHWLNEHCITCEARSSVNEMELWGVPRNYVDGQLHRLLRIAEGPPTSSHALVQIFGEYDYWHHHTEWYVKRVLPLLTAVLAIVVLEGLGWSIYWAFFRKDLLVAFLLAGASGAALSILLKQPSFGVYGQLVKTWVWMIGRFATGVAASAVGFGLLGWGVIAIGLPIAPESSGSEEPRVMTLATMMERCLACRSESERCPWQSTPDASGAPAVAGGVEGRAPNGATVEEDSGQGATGSFPRRCSQTWMAGLLGLGLLLGFSERALSGMLANFDGRFGDKTRPRSPPPAPVTQPANAGKGSGGALT